MKYMIIKREQSSSYSFMWQYYFDYFQIGGDYDYIYLHKPSKTYQIVICQKFIEKYGSSAELYMRNPDTWEYELIMEWK